MCVRNVGVLPFPSSCRSIAVRRLEPSHLPHSLVPKPRFNLSDALVQVVAGSVCWGLISENVLAWFKMAKR